MVKRIVWSQVAKNDLKEILDYWNKRNGNKNYSKKLNFRIRSAIIKISRNNFIGKPTNDPSRMIILGDYALFYEIHQKAIIILKIWDTRRKPDSLTLDIETPQL